MKRLKNMFVMCLVVAVCSIILGIVFGIQADNCKGAMVYTGGYGGINYAGTIGGNKEGQETFTILSIVMYIMGVLWGIGAFILYTRYNVIKRQPISKAEGKVLEKENFMVTIEFSDGNRRKMIIEPDVLVAQGEMGEIKYKDKAGVVVGFKKQ